MQFKPPSQPGWGPSEPEEPVQQPFPGWQQQPSMDMPIPPVYVQSATNHLPQQPMMPVPPPRKRLESMAALWISVSLLIGIVLVFVAIGISARPASTSPGTGTWTLTHSYSGNGIQQTESFTVSSEWILQWECDPTSFITSYNVIVNIRNTDGSLADVAVNTICSDSNTGGGTILHQGGTIYLEINSEAAWTLTIKELR